MERRKVGVLCVQETRWKGDKAKELGGGCKLLRSGANKQGRNGVGIVISKDLKEDLISVSKRSGRVEETVVNICSPSRLYRGGKRNVLGTYGSRAECDTG